MKRIIPTLILAVFALHASAQVISTLKSYLLNVTPAPPDHLVQGEDGTLYGMSHNMLYRWQPDGSGLEVLKQSDPFLESFIGPLSLSGSTLYGMVYYADSLKVFKTNTDGSGYTVFEEDILAGNFLRKYQVFSTSRERPGVVLSGTTLYGWGFKINTDGTGYTELAGFPPWHGLQDWYLEFEVSGDNYFGSTSIDGLYGAGTVFRLNTNGGTGYTLNVAAGDGWSIGGWRLKAVGDTLYGYGFSDRMFEVNTDGTGYNVLSNANLPSWNNRLEHSDGAFYWAGASFTNNQTIWAVRRMNTDGTGYTVLRNSTNGMSILTVAGGAIYGVTSLAGTGGTLFKMNTDGSSFAVLHEFSEPNPYPDGKNPAALTVSDGVLYGFDSGPDLNPRLFKMSTDGAGFTAVKGYDPVDRFDPSARPTVSGSTLFGVGGRGAYVVVYRMNTDGTGYTVLKEFTLADADQAPAGAVALSGGALYGTIGTAGAGANSGKIFKLNTDGTGYTILRAFSPTTLNTSSGYWTNSEGLFREPSEAELTASGNTLYGTAFSGGQFGCGTVFKMNTDGTGFTVLKHLTRQEGSYAGSLLTLVGDTLYGASDASAEGVGGTVWRVNTNGTGFMVVKQFPNAVWDNALGYTNSEGVNPTLGLAVWGNTIYGTTSRGGQFGKGTLFKVNTDGTGFLVLQHIEEKGYATSGSGLRGLVLSGNTIYGAAPSGGDDGIGAIYRIDLVPTLSIKRASPNSLAVTWPTVWTDYVLQQNVNGVSSLNWSNATGRIQDDGTNRTLIVNPTNQNRFYRLNKF